MKTLLDAKAPRLVAAILLGGGLGILAAGYIQAYLGADWTYTGYYIGGAAGIVLALLISRLVMDVVVIAKKIAAAVRRGPKPTEPWRPNLPWWQAYGLWVIALALFVPTFIMGFTAFIVMTDYIPPYVETTRSFDELAKNFGGRVTAAPTPHAVVWALFAIFVAILVNGMTCEKRVRDTDADRAARIEHSRQRALWWIRWLNPASATIATAYAALVVLAFGMKYSLPILRVLFVEAHSTAGTVAGVYGVLAVVFGFFFGYGLSAAGICATVGLLNYLVYTDRMFAPKRLVLIRNKLHEQFPF